MKIFEPLWPFEGHAKASCLDLIPDFDSNTTKSSFLIVEPFSGGLGGVFQIVIQVHLSVSA